MRTEGDLIKINEWLLPFSWLYGIGVRFRNCLFEMGVLKSTAFDIPVISVGNITVGGSGKTPHVEYLIRLLEDKVKVAVLSRGYKRKSRGYLLADTDTTMEQIGDEPFQMKKKYPNAYIAVDGNRRRGINRLITDEATNDTDVVLLDDAFQHRYVKPGINILLVDYHRIIIYDKLLPAGRLREPHAGKNRADIVIITKCPKDLNPMEFRVLTKAMDLYPYQSLFFSTIEYVDPQAVFDEKKIEKEDLKDYNILLLTGIASPQQMEQDLTACVKTLTPMSYPDHHRFTTRDIEDIERAFTALPEPRIILTTEKDAARLSILDGFSEDTRKHLYALPIQTKFMLDDEELFNNKIIDYVRKNSRNSILVKGKDDNKSKNGNHTRNRSRTISFRDN
uniref:Tetraacyldisaccharide 4'-kinase n=1 Tax=Prevotella sp. GTC17254 TaxID=3236794 RepID=A0AB33ITZ7_9BACT